ncbi:MAG: hypothetical protein ACTHYU_07225, partial [Senegalia sp. (in: firmicutes)]
MRNKKIISIILVLFISIFIASCTNDSAESPEDNNSNNNEEEMPNDDKKNGDENKKDNEDKEEEDKWAKYTNARFKFSIKYPKGWEYRESD